MTAQKTQKHNDQHRPQLHLTSDTTSRKIDYARKLPKAPLNPLCHRWL